MLIQGLTLWFAPGTAVTCPLPQTSGAASSPRGRAAQRSSGAQTVPPFHSSVMRSQQIWEMSESGPGALPIQSPWRNPTDDAFGIASSSTRTHRRLERTLSRQHFIKAPSNFRILIPKMSWRFVFVVFLWARVESKFQNSFGMGLVGISDSTSFSAIRINSNLRNMI